MSIKIKLAGLLRPKSPTRFRVRHFYGGHFVLQYRWHGLMWVNVSKFFGLSHERLFPLLDTQAGCISKAIEFCSSPTAFAEHHTQQDREYAAACASRAATTEFTAPVRRMTP